MKNQILLFLVLLFSACHTKQSSINYFDQPFPGNIPEIFALGKISIQNRLEHGISFSPDGKELAFGILNSEDFSGEIYHSIFKNKEWQAPEKAKFLGNESVFLPYYSPDGKSLLFAKSQPDTNNGFTDIWLVNRNANGWETPQKLKSPVSSLTREANACMTLDRTIYFTQVSEMN